MEMTNSDAVFLAISVDTKQCTSVSSQLPSLSSRLPSPATNRPTHLRIRNPKPPSLSHHLFLAPEKDSHSSVAPKWPSPCMIRAKGRRKKNQEPASPAFTYSPKLPCKNSTRSSSTAETRERVSGCEQLRIHQLRLAPRSQPASH